MRKILISPGYGAGWTSWHHGSREEKLFMLEHESLIHAVENPSGVKVQFTDSFGEIDSALSAALEVFKEEWKAKFTTDLPYLGGANALKVIRVPGSVRIKEYDGYESIDYGDDDYL